ncbi:MAG: hypothetical protein L0K63_03600 [Yaniella sp.]|nr:hypothetical protein [Yaniella sp.]
MSYQQPPQGPPPPEYNPGQPGPADHVPQQHGRRRGKRRLMWGIILMAIGLIGGIAGALIFGFSAFEQFDDFEDNTYDGWAGRQSVVYLSNRCCRRFDHL